VHFRHIFIRVFVCYFYRIYVLKLRINMIIIKIIIIIIIIIIIMFCKRLTVCVYHWESVNTSV